MAKTQYSGAAFRALLASALFAQSMVLLACGRFTAYSLRGASQRLSGDAPACTWLDDENAVMENGFSLIPAEVDEIKSGYSVQVLKNGTSATVAVILKSGSFNGAAFRIKPNDPSWVFKEGKWGVPFEAMPIKLFGVVEGAVDAGVFTEHLETDPAVFAGATVFEATFEYDADGAQREVNRAPRGEANRVDKVDVFLDRAGDVHVSWTERNLGDYDNDGEVAVPDLTPIALNFLATEGELLIRVDGDKNGEIGVSDITPIAQNYGAKVAGYNVYRIEEQNGIFSLASRLPNRQFPSSLVSINRQDGPVTTLFAEYEYIDEKPPADRRYLYEVRASDGMYEEGERTFPAAEYTFSVESSPDWAVEQTVATSFGHSVTVPAGGLPDGAVLVIEGLAPQDIVGAPQSGLEFICGVEISVYDESGNPLQLQADAAVVIPIPLGIAAISEGAAPSGLGKSASVAAPANMDFWMYTQPNQFLPMGQVALNAESNAYTGAVSATGSYCVFGNIEYDKEPPVWNGAAGASGASLIGDNLVEVAFGTASDASGPVTYNVYYWTISPIDFAYSSVERGFTESPAVIQGARGAATYYFTVRAQDAIGNEERNTTEVSLFVPRPNDCLFLTTDKEVYELGETIYLTANAKTLAGRMYQMNQVRISYTPNVKPQDFGFVTLGSFFDFKDGFYLPAPVIPIAGNPSMLEFNASFVQSSTESPPGSSGDLFSFPWTPLSPGYLTFGVPDDPAVGNPNSYYTAFGDNTPIKFKWHQGVTVKIVEPGQAAPSPNL